MKLLVTGGAGFIGSNFINYWLNKYPNDSIINLDIQTYAANPLTIKYHQENFKDRYEHILGDITNPDMVNEVVKKVDTIVHFAAESHVDRSVTEPAAFVKTNVLGTQVLLDAARLNGNKRFHHVSTDEVFGTLDLNSDEKFDENTPYSPRSPYSASKAGSDHLAFAYYETYGLPVTISNCTNNYGPFHFPEKVIPLYITRAMRDLPIPVYGKGIAIRDYIHTEDHARGVELILLKGKIGERYCLGGDAEKNTVEVAHAILDKLGKSYDLIRHTADRPGHDPRYAIDHTKATNELGWNLQYTFETGIENTIQWYKKHLDWWMPISQEAERVAEKYLANSIQL